ncbi:MAG: cyanophycinase [Gemmatimonadota bacterium]|nr:cyanophycinase [Gemmatimonadota bacterium]
MLDVRNDNLHRQCVSTLTTGPENGIINFMTNNRAVNREFPWGVVRVAAALVLTATACSTQGPHSTLNSVPAADPKVGPLHGSVLVVGGGAQGPEVFAKLIELAGGPDALIVDVPTAGGDTAYGQDWRGTRGLKAAGAKNVYVLHTSNRKVADSDSFIAPIRNARGIWFEGGRHYHLIDSYLGTKTQKALADILARGGVAAGSSAGASILGSFLVRGAPSNNNEIMDYPGYETGFAYLRGVGIDQHVVARERLADLADSIIPRHPELLGISEDEGTAWVVQGDIAEIIGRNKAFVYNGKDRNDEGKPFLTLHPGDRYDLAARRVIHRAIDETKLTQKFVDGIFADYAKAGSTGATVLVAANGKVFVDASYGIPPQRKFMPTTTIPNFPLGGLSEGFNAAATIALLRADKIKLDDMVIGEPRATYQDVLSDVRSAEFRRAVLTRQLAAASGGTYEKLVTDRIMTPIGMHKTKVDAKGEWQSNVDELYRWELGLTANRAFRRDSSASATAPVNLNAPGWTVDSYKGTARQSEFYSADGRRNAFVRFPEKGAVIIILTNDSQADARGMANRIADKLLFDGQK